MGGFVSGLFGGGKVDNSAALAAERRAQEAEAKVKAQEEAQKTAETYRLNKQRGKAATLLSTDSTTDTRTLLGG